MKRLFLFLVMISWIGLANASDPDSTQKYKKAQITFIYPLSSNGFESMEYSNKYSLNVLFGMNGGLDGGIEWGGWANYNHGSVRGAQFAGMFNINKEETQGFIASGIANLSGKDSKGAMMSGIVNATNGNSKGFQAAGVINSTIGSFEGAGFAGVLNYALDSTSGFLAAGALNVVTSSSRGFHASPVNVTIKKMDGFQLGVVNYAGTLSGTQLGIVNVATDLEKGVPIGLLNVVKGGLFEVELLAGETMFTNVNYKMGVDQFYTIFKMGFTTFNDKPVVSYGAGFGTGIAIGQRHKLNIDLSASQLNYDGKWDGKINLLNKLDFNMKIAISDHVAIIAGPSFNVYVTQERVGEALGTIEVPYTFYEHIGDKTMVSSWVGGNAGVAFRF